MYIVALPEIKYYIMSKHNITSLKHIHFKGRVYFCKHFILLLRRTQYRKLKQCVYSPYAELCVSMVPDHKQTLLILQPHSIQCVLIFSHIFSRLARSGGQMEGGMNAGPDHTGFVCIGTVYTKR